MLSKLFMHLAMHGVGIDRIALPGDREPASLRRTAEHRRVLAEMRREARAAELLQPAGEPTGIVTRLRESLSR